MSDEERRRQSDKVVDALNLKIEVIKKELSEMNLHLALAINKIDANHKSQTERMERVLGLYEKHDVAIYGKEGRNGINGDVHLLKETIYGSKSNDGLERKVDINRTYILSLTAVISFLTVIAPFAINFLTHQK